MMEEPNLGDFEIFSKVENLIRGCLPSQINLESEECDQSEHLTEGS